MDFTNMETSSPPHPILSLSPPSSIAMPVSTKPQQRTGKRAPVPLILESFPTPPSFIPPSPHTPPPNSAMFPLATHAPSLTPNSALSRPLSASFNPPPSLPPAAPLPPLPGPSPISDHDSLLILSSRSRRSSRISVHSARTSYSSNRDSEDTPTSANSVDKHGLVSPTSSANTFGPSGFRGSVASTRSAQSYSSNGSISSQSPVFTRSPFMEKSSSVGYAISEEGSTELAHAERESHTTSNKENARGLPARREPRRAYTDDSIASVDMRDIPQDDGVDHDLQVQSFHLRMRATRSKSESHKRALRSQNSSPALGSSASSSTTRSNAVVPPIPATRSAHSNIRSTSPDIATMISTTPRPRAYSQYSNESRRSDSGSRSRPGSRPGSMRRYASDSLQSAPRNATMPRSVSDGLRSQSPVELAYLHQEGGSADVEEEWNEDSFVSDYGTPVDGHDNYVDMDPELEARLDAGGSDSDSSLDLHTPLPHLMLRHGLLSPHSKLLPESNRAPSPLTPLPDTTRPGSIMSVASNTSLMTKTGLFKDQRDTPQRRVRHRDGRQLRAGMGLTTGLGWSDSEDEDAPSPLTRRLSSLNLNGRSSTSSLRSSTHALSRSQSNSTLHEEDEKDVSTVQRRPGSRARPSLPPTSWHKQSANANGRASTSSVGSSFSLTLSIPEEPRDGDSKFGSSRRSTDASGHARSGRDMVDTPSTASTTSLPMPSTPEDGPAQQKLDKDKGLPPLPGLRKYPSSLALRTPSTSGSSSDAIPRLRTHSNASSVSSSNAVSGHIVPVPPIPAEFASSALPVTPSYTPRTTRTPRPLRLSQSISPSIQPGEQPPHSGKILGYNRNIHDQQRMRAASGPARSTIGSNTAPTTPTTPGFSKPMPRTGTGMVYRTSSNPGLAPQSRMRMPSTQSFNTTSTSTPRTTRPPAVPRPIAL